MIKIVPIQKQISAKSSSPQPFSEPENMTTVELNKNGYFSNEPKKNHKPDTNEKFKVSKIMRALLVGIGIFILMGLCLSILILLIHRGSSKHNREINETKEVQETSLKSLLNNKEMIKACKSSKSFEDCCHVFFRSNAFNKCSVQRVLNLFLQYELESNKRIKRQNYEEYNLHYQDDYPAVYYPQNAYQQNNYDLNVDTNLYDQQQLSNYNEYDYRVPEDNINSYYDKKENFFGYQEQGKIIENQHVMTNVDQNLYNQQQPSNFNGHRSIVSDKSIKKFYGHRENPFTYYLNQKQLKSVRNQQIITTEKPFQSPTKQFSPKSASKTSFFKETNSWKSTTMLPKTCADDKKCPTVINATTKIANISNLIAEPGHLKIALNKTSIKLTPSIENGARISQGNDFELKPVDVQNQPKQVNPCYYSFPGPFVSPYPSPINYDSNVFGRVNQHQPLYIINPPIYPPISMPYQGYGNYLNQQMNKNPIQVAGAGGQFYLCNPLSAPSNNVVGLQGVEVRRMSQAFSLQDLVEAMPKKSNKTREALDCPIGTNSCSDGSKCIHSSQLCDNEVNCGDASDEVDCSCKSRVGEIRWCDGYLDCPNGEDEHECFGCKSDEFSCDDWSTFQKGTCIPLSQRCDGIRHCEITGKDEEDCTILTDHLGHHSMYKISNAAGFLHRNYKGKWYPTCFGVDIFSIDVCTTEAGPSEIIPHTHLITSNDNYIGSYLGVSSTNGIVLSNDCMKNKAAFVECPPLFCGLRLTIRNPFRTSEVDTSAEELISRMHLSRFSNREIVGKSRVVGGKPSQPTSWPWVVSIYKNGIFHCGGVLINEMWILTAAHCVDRFWFFFYEIQVGMLRRFSYAPMEQNRFASVVIPHETYSKRTLKNDIALIKLSKPVRFNRYVRPICLPSEMTAGDDFLQGPKANTICVTVGWGATVEHGADPDHLREVEVPILPNCKHIEDKEGDEICAGLLEGGRDACQGDSGGPLMCQNTKNSNQWYLAGIVSHGEGCARPNEPGVYTKVSKYIGWINENINGKLSGRLPLQKCPGYVCQGTKKCLSKKKRCDKIVDCLFGDDEENCWQSHQSSILGSRHKNFVNDLANLLNFNNSSEEIDNKSSEFRNHTHDITDESFEDEQKYFTCKNLFQMIPFNEKCDRVVNCEDGSDESDCSCVDYLKRFHKDAICDGVTDCKDMSDESDCVKCFPSQYLCRISQKCISLANRCDGSPNCLSSEDEWDCVSLTDGRTLVLDSDLRPKQSMKGIITINRFGVWRPLCSNASVDNAASIATNVCNLLGFEEYTAFHKLSVVDKPLNVTIDGFERYHSSLDELPLCGGLFVGCLNVSLEDNQHELNRDNITSQVELYTSPWNAVIYSDGKFTCTGTILNPHWIITANNCFLNSLPNDKYIAVLVGKGKAHLDVEGPHEQILTVNKLAFVNETETVILHTQQKINFNRYVKPAQLTTKSVFIKELCVAIGFENKTTKTVFAYPKKECKPGFKCFETSKNCKDEKLEPGHGIITCINSRNGWYTAAVHNNVSDFCNFSQKEFNVIDERKVRLAMGNELEKIVPPECKGFRCLLGNCIHKNQICDGIFDCRSGEDEDSKECLKLREECPLSSNCSNYSSCKAAEFRCKNGTCIPKTLFCNGINDCDDNSDEPWECSCRTYLEKVHPEKICDGTVNCWDRNDEKPERCACKFPSDIKCGKTKVCISKEMICDGIKDCPNGEDETRCYSLRTSLSNTNSGEVMRRTGGIWHSGCFARNHTTSELEEICERLGFAGGSAKLVPPQDTNLALKAVLDRFDFVRNQIRGSKLKIRFRTGNEPYVKFVEDPDCHKLYLECL